MILQRLLFVVSPAILGGRLGFDGGMNHIQMCVIQKGLEVSSREAFCLLGDPVKVDVRGDRKLSGYSLEDLGEGKRRLEVGTLGLLTSFLSLKSGILHRIDLSKRPGRRRAESMRSGRLPDHQLYHLFPDSR
jgi:hypothetical protein